MNTRARFVAAVVLALWGAVAQATMLEFKTVTLDFTKPEVAKQATWTKAATLKRGPKGLEHEAPGPESLDLFVQTEPVAIGLSWRPATAVSVTAKLRPTPTVVKLPNGQEFTPSSGQFFVRFSPDATHWSTWQVLASDPDLKSFKFSGAVSVSRQDSADYAELVSKYMQLDVPWKSDEEACAAWIVKAHPDFFSQHLPFMGYLEFLYETDLSGGQRLERIDLELSYALPGLQAIPKDPKAQEGRDGPWRFKAR